MIVYKIFLEDDFKSLKKYGVSAGSKLDQKDGFIHLSTANQLEKTLQVHFASVSTVCLLKLKINSMKKLKWETSRNKELFPHLYGKIYTHYINSQIFLNKLNDEFQIPASFLKTHE